ncbi:MAG: hypothetical protein M1837_000407 [Sclerophora amabilis]|nr:MAG: hypothetical protein M1837_000407 [Sclerophora amabilis]
MFPIQSVVSPVARSGRRFTSGLGSGGKLQCQYAVIRTRGRRAFPQHLTSTLARRFYNSAAGIEADPKPPRQLLSRTLKFLAISTVSFLLGVSMASSAEISSLSERTSPSDAETLELFQAPDEATAKIDRYIRDHPLSRSLRKNQDYTESRPHLQILEHQRHRNFTAGTLAGPGKLVVPPYIFSENGGKDFTSIAYLGEDVCGYPDVVHGGLLATMLDEGLARCCFPALPNKLGMTASLNINYRKPAPAAAYYVLKAKTVKVEGRKAWVEGHIENLVDEGQEPTIFVEASALFVEPKNAATLRRVFPIRGDNAEKEEKSGKGDLTTKKDNPTT